LQVPPELEEELLELDEELELELLDEELLELEDELDEELLELEDELELPFEQAAPLTVGVSAEPPLVLP